MDIENTSILQFSCVNTETTPMKQVFYHFISLYHCLGIGLFFGSLDADIYLMGKIA